MSVPFLHIYEIKVSEGAAYVSLSKKMCLIIVVVNPYLRSSDGGGKAAYPNPKQVRLTRRPPKYTAILGGPIMINPLKQFNINCSYKSYKTDF